MSDRATKYNDTKFNEWIAEGKAPAIPATLRLYNTLISLGIKIVFLTGTSQRFLDIRTVNLKKAGFYTWEKLILKPTSTGHISSLEYKSKNRDELVLEGYRIVGNIGDQWSDILGTNVGLRTFKLPDPMYYIA
ncbi:hypothetical protein M9H77_37228 [Catharanthus roseus]|uniref:Uncharacterized protein n=1 Tax=Catharanthus roseus TaxID=4058 RepID=A0ACB9ZUV2_CATRO|nr:hypothetical protein M9H77_37228 [Catharanthus roseus]